jgi:hypothetical protein
MPALRTTARLAAVLLAGGLAAAVVAQPPDPKPPDPPKAGAKAADPPTATVRLPDGTLLWLGPAPADADRVWISPQDLQKLSDQADRLKKQLAARKPAAPSGCAVRGRVEKRGDTSVAAVRVVLTVRTTEPNTTVAVGGKRAFLVAATLDGDRTPVLEATEDGFSVVIEAPGDHALTLDLEAPVAGRGAKAEVGFELGLPKAPITTLALEPPPGVGRVNLAAKLPDPPPPGKPAEPRRVAGLDVARLAPRPDGGGYPLGPVEAVEVTWDPPAAVPPTDAVRSAEVEVAVQITAESVETAAKVRPRGANRSWKVAAPAGATLTADRAAPNRDATAGTTEAAVVGKPADPAKPVWTVELPPGAAAADWVFTVAHRADRPPPADPGYAGPYPIGPIAVLDAIGQTGTVKLTAPANTRLVVRGAGLRQVEPAGPPEPGEVVAAYRLAAGQTGGDYPAAPLATVEARPLAGTVEVRPAYQLTLTDAGWRVRAELRVVPIRREVDAVRIDLPADWRNPGVAPPELVEGVQPVPADGGRQGLVVKLAAGHRGPFTLTLTATTPAGGPVHFPRFPDAAQRDAAVTAIVPEGQEVRGTGREWDGDQPADADQPLAPVPGPDGRPPKVVAAVAGRFDRGPARLDLTTAPARPELAADVRAAVTVQPGQVVVNEQVRLRAPDGFGRPVRFRGPAELRGLRASPPLTPAGPGEWTAALPTEAKEATVGVSYALPLPPKPADGAGPWRVPVGLLGPAGATRTESEVRVWSRLGTGQAVGVASDGWRELPPAADPDRDALPVKALAGAGPDLPLTLEIGEAADAAFPAWVERGLIQTWAGDEGEAAYRVRFLVRRWLTDAAEVPVPDGVIGPVQVLLDGRPVEAPPSTAEGGRVLRVPLPEPGPGRAVVLELRYRLRSGELGEEAGAGVAWPRAGFAGPVRWQAAGPAGTVPLVLGGRADYRWRVRSGLPVAAPAGNAEAADRWFAGEPGGDGGAGPTESATVWLVGPEPARVIHLPHLPLVVGCSLAVFLVGLLLSRLPGRAVGPAVAAVGGLVAVAAALDPQPAAQAAGAATPGLAAVGLVLTARAAAGWYHRRRVTYLPGFVRGRPGSAAEVPAAVPSSARGRPSPNGSTGPHDPAVVPVGSSGT